MSSRELSAGAGVGLGSSVFGRDVGVGLLGMVIVALGDGFFVGIGVGVGVVVGVWTGEEANVGVGVAPGDC